MNKWLIVSLAAQVLVCGCASYRFDANIEGRNIASVKGRYRIEAIDFKVELNEIPFTGEKRPMPSSPPQVGWSLDEDKIRDFVKDRYPDVFSDDESAIPIKIKMSSDLIESRYSWTILCPYLISLGVLPGGGEDATPAKLKVYAGEDLMATKAISYEYDAKVSVFSPLGAIPFSKDIDRQYVQRDEVVLNIAAVQNKVRGMSEKIFLETFADGVVSCLVEGERQDRKVQQSLSDRLRRLDELHDKGILTDAEYVRKVKELK